VCQQSRAGWLDGWQQESGKWPKRMRHASETCVHNSSQGSTAIAPGRRSSGWMWMRGTDPKDQRTEKGLRERLAMVWTKRANPKRLKCVLSAVELIMKHDTHTLTHRTAHLHLRLTYTHLFTQRKNWNNFMSKISHDIIFLIFLFNLKKDLEYKHLLLYFSKCMT